MYGNLVFDKGGISNYWGKRWSTVTYVRTIRHIFGKNIYLILTGFVTSYARKQGGHQRLMGHVRSKSKQAGASIREESHWHNIRIMKK